MRKEGMRAAGVQAQQGHTCVGFSPLRCTLGDLCNRGSDRGSGESTGTDCR